MFTAAYNRIDAEYYPAHTAAAAYFVAHDDPDHAAEELNEALTGNPHDLAAHALAGKIAVDGFNFAATEQQISAIRDVDGDSIDAELLDARDLLQQRRPEEAEMCIRDSSSVLWSLRSMAMIWAESCFGETKLMMPLHWLPARGEAIV